MRDAMANLPIPSRLLATLVILLGALVAPHSANLSPMVVGAFYCAALWRLLALSRPTLIPGRWVLLLLMLGGMATVVFSTGIRDGRLTGTALLVVMVGLKLLELKARRDMHVTIFLGYFLVLTQFLYNQTLGLAIYMFCGVIGLLAVQIGLNRVHIDSRQQLVYTLRVAGGALPLALVIFVLFPRLETPLWGINTASAVTGISGEMTLGNIGELSQSDATAFRVRFDGDVPPPAARYWRGPVLWHTDGRRWTAGRRPVRPEQVEGVSPNAIVYEVTLEPTGEYWLFGLDIVTSTPPSTFLNRDFSLVGDQRVNKRFTYRAASDPDYRVATMTQGERLRGLQLPDEIAPRVSQLVKQWMAESDPDQPLQVVEKALRYFRQQPFVYTLSPGVIEGDPLDTFLFETRRGFCEHYAGSFTQLMRMAGIPARVVVGYQGGEKNPHAEHWVVRQSDAHAWSEVWVPGRGWWRVDPTAAIAPERVERSIDPGLSQDGDEIVFSGDNSGLLRVVWLNARWMADAVDLNWHRWVVGFTAERQQSLLRQYGLSDLQGIGLGIALLIGGLVAVGSVYLISKLPRPRRGDPLPAIWQRLVRKLRRAGLTVDDWQGPDTVCSNAIVRFPDAADQLAAINRMYVKLRYGRQSDRSLVSALYKRVAQLKLR
ncbi:transglutaminase TgpA family protein [Thiosocius teredinicola]|uniref:transglutaminase TgpA family protein n=1 Tax=Thiosocius teredinicola TaxID=1973002 RepID=UPI0013DDD889